jgi:hypothetical protein
MAAKRSGFAARLAVARSTPLDLPGNLWTDIAVAMPNDLFDRVDGYIQASFL